MAGKPRPDRDTVRAESIAVRVTSDEKARIKAAALSARRTVSDWLLLLAEDALKQKDAKP